MSFLNRILAEKQKEIRRRMRSMPLKKLEVRTIKEPVRDFLGAVNGHGRIIAEIKRRSPTTGEFRSSAVLDELPLIYERNGASALSVVTDTANFGITLEDARKFRSKTRLPMLVKDFFIDPYQIAAARSYNADAILLIARILSIDRIASLLELTHEQGMHAIVEVHSRADIEKALEVGAKVIGINNRDLDTLTTDVEMTRKLLPMIPEGIIIVSESGIGSRREIQSLASEGVNAFLIGRALLDAPDPGRLLRQLSGKG